MTPFPFQRRPEVVAAHWLSVLVGETQYGQGYGRKQSPKHIDGASMTVEQFKELFRLHAHAPLCRRPCRWDVLTVNADCRTTLPGSSPAPASARGRVPRR